MSLWIPSFSGNCLPTCNSCIANGVCAYAAHRTMRVAHTAQLTPLVAHTTSHPLHSPRTPLAAHATQLTQSHRTRRSPLASHAARRAHQPLHTPLAAHAARRAIRSLPVAHNVPVRLSSCKPPTVPVHDALLLSPLPAHASSPASLLTRPPACPPSARPAHSPARQPAPHKPSYPTAAVAAP